ncbi:MAG: class I SAM-dependent methyltransferase, partial [Methylococcales bacterium]|nr:class I SAM-dependent methyltransferase [Methylococcales bacterium]
MDNCEAILQEGLAFFGLNNDQKNLEKLLNFIALMMKWNKAYNLTAIRDPDEMAKLHILDSLAISPYLQG